MAKKNKDYWQVRAEQKVLACEKMILDYEKRMKSAFFDAVKDLDKEITKLYVKYARDNKLSYSETLKYLRNEERLEFQKDLKWYIKHAENPKYRNEHRQELQALSVRARVKRIEQMKANIIMESEHLFQKLQRGTLSIFEQVYDEAYHRTAFDMFQGFGMGAAFHRPAKGVINALVNYPWSGKSYSENLWDMEKGFVDGLNRVMTAGLIRGQSVLEMGKALRDEALGRDFGKGKPGGQLNKAQRLVRTEANFILNQATADMYEELEVEQYEFLGTLDSLTCSHCGGLDGKHYPVGEEKAGVNYPPLHPRCRCTTVPYFPEDEDDPGTRIARDAEGKNYHVPADMTYQEWWEGLSENEKEKMVLRRKMDRNLERDKEQLERVKKILGKQAPQSIAAFQYLKYNDIETWEGIKTLLRRKNYLQEQLPYIYHGERLFIPRHTSFEKVKVIAGADSETPIRIVDRLIEKHGGSANDWQKKVAKVTSEKYIFDIHWYERDGIQYEPKIKSCSERRKGSK